MQPNAGATTANPRRPTYVLDLAPHRANARFVAAATTITTSDETSFVSQRNKLTWTLRNRTNECKKGEKHANNQTMSLLADSWEIAKTSRLTRAKSHRPRAPFLVPSLENYIIVESANNKEARNQQSTDRPTLRHPHKVVGRTTGLT